MLDVDSRKARRLLAFGAVGGFGMLLNTLILYALTGIGVHYLLASIIATEAAILSNFINNHVFTFKNSIKGPWLRKLVSFQTISVTTILGTASILWLLVTLFGERLLLVWNAVAILVMFLFNFSLNSRYTWPENDQNALKVVSRASVVAAAIFLSAMFSTVEVAAADTVAVSQLGYHPDSFKQVVVYTGASSGTAYLHQQGSGLVVAQFALSKPVNYYGASVECQGNQSCLVADFSSFKTPGAYYVETADGDRSPSFIVSSSVFSGNAPVLLEFFNAQLQQDSAYHADMHSGYDPAFNAIADGSFLMESDQASISLMRLGSAYRRNPAVFSSDSYNILAAGKPDIQEYIVTYVDYLEGLQGVEVEERSDGSGFRLDRGVKVNNAFVPGPTSLTSLDVYIPGSPPQLLETVPVVSLCGADDGSPAWDSCVADAALYYKCQVDEPCLSISYVDKTGSVLGRSGYAMPKGWGYEFGCFFDVELGEEIFNGKYNPCMVFHPESSRDHTAKALLAYLEAVPAVYDYSSARGESLLSRAVATYDYIKGSYPAFGVGDSDAGYWGASLFLLYDYTGSSSYLAEAYGMRDKVSALFISDATRGNDFYWEEYVRHRAAIAAAGFSYQYNGQNPEEFFRGKMFGDYKDLGYTSISNNGERVYQFAPGIQFHNSRYMLIEGLFAAKTGSLHPSPESFITDVADAQLAWLTGMNRVQQDVSLGSPVGSMSFIYGIGDFPEKFHSRYLVDTGYSAASNGEVVGARGTDLLFYNGSGYVSLDGKHEILGSVLGSLGNGWKSEPKLSTFSLKPFNNGKSYIPGWISGAFDITTPAETDVIFNFKDSFTYEFTETTNEMVAIAVELFAYRDAELNNRQPHPGIPGGIPPEIIVGNSTNATIIPPGNSTNNTITPPNNGTNATISPPGNSTGTQGNSSAKITGSSTNLTKPLPASAYHMFETDSARFFVNLNQSGNVSWSVDGKGVLNTTGPNSTFIWTPGLLYTSNVKKSAVTASTGTDFEQWDVDVEFVVNAFFSGQDDGPDSVGSADAKVHVFTNTKKASFTQLAVVLESEGGVKSTHNLAVQFANNSEVDWSAFIQGLPYGDSYIAEAVGFDNNTNLTTKFVFPRLRAHYHNWPPNVQSNSQSSSVSSSERSSEEAAPRQYLPNLVYVLFEHDVVNISQRQRVTLDAKIDRGEILGIRAFILTPAGSRMEPNLKLVSGTAGYGTWQAEFDVPSVPGRYLLERVAIRVNNTRESFQVLANGTSFYAINETVSPEERLMLVNTLLNVSVVDPRGRVLFSVDARDSAGITNATAEVEISRGRKRIGIFTVQLGLKGNNSQYGTWQAVIAAEEQDSTYSVREVTLYNRNDSKPYAITKRSFYVNPERKSASLAANQITGYVTGPIERAGKWSIDQIRKMPLVPTLLGFGIALAIAGVMVTGGNVKQRLKGARSEGEAKG